MTDINITQSNTILTNNKSMTDDKFVDEVEEGVITDSNKTKMPPLKTRKTRLSVVSQQYDINKDGVLDEAELAMRKLDKSGRGFLTNDKIYALMQEQLALQKSMFQMKRIIFGLLAFVVVLALANLGTSFASALLAKDTTTSNGQLVDKKTNKAMATATAVETYTVQEDDGENARRLVECLSSNVAKDCNATVTTSTTMSNTSALAMLKSCRDNKNVQLQLTSTDNNIVTTTTTTVCALGWCSGSSYTTEDTILVAGELCIRDSTVRLNVTKTIGVPATYTLSQDMFAMTYPTESTTTAIPAEPTTAEPTTAEPTTARPTATARPTTKKPTTKMPTRSPTTKKPTASPTTKMPTASPTNATPTTSKPTASPTNATPTTSKPTASPTTIKPTRLLDIDQQCRFNADCFSGHCFMKTCVTSTCFPTGDPCTSNDDCCSGICRLGQFGFECLCIPTSTNFGNYVNSCNSRKQCCLGTCGGTCNCYIIGDVRTFNFECCSGLCDNIQNLHSGGTCIPLTYAG